MYKISPMSKRHSNAARAHFKATDPDVWVSVSQAAKLLDCTRQTLYNMINRGQILTDHIAGRLVVRKSSLIDFQKERVTA